jgi:NitT/TauT family transport system ATP-binding protein
MKMTAVEERQSPSIELINVNRRFVTPDGRSMTALRDFTMTVERGEFVAVVGPTGCGKSTTLNLITGLARPTTGEVRVMGAPVNGIDRRIGFVFQTDALFPWRSVIDNVVAGPLFRGKPRQESYELARHWLARVHLAGHESKYPHQLSGGMRKRVSLAQTFINEPEILLMDEPFSALDGIAIVGRVRDTRSRRGHCACRQGLCADRRPGHGEVGLQCRSATAARRQRHPLRSGFHRAVAYDLE